MSHQSGETPPEPVYRQALEQFQHYAGLLVTGKMDSATEAKLTGPRCGAKDFKQIPNLRRKRFVKQGTNWKKMVLCSIYWTMENMVWDANLYKEDFFQKIVLTIF